MPARRELVEPGDDALGQPGLEILGRHPIEPLWQLAAMSRPQFPQQLADGGQILRPSHLGMLDRAGLPLRLLALLMPLEPIVGRPEQVALAGRDPAEGAPGQPRLDLHEEMQGVVRQVVVVPGAVPWRQLRPAFADDGDE